MKLSNKSIFIGLISGLAVISGACATPAPQAKSSLEKLRDTYDIASRHLVGNEPAKSEIVYADTTQFDTELHVALKNKLDRVKISFPEPLAIRDKQLPPRIDHWLSTVKSGGGEVRTCPVEMGGGMDMMSLTLITDILFAIVKGVDNFITYRPAKQYNAIVFVSLEKPDSALGLSFVHKNKFEGFDDRCIAF